MRSSNALNLNKTTYPNSETWFACVRMAEKINDSACYSQTVIDDPHPVVPDAKVSIAAKRLYTFSTPWGTLKSSASTMVLTFFYLSLIGLSFHLEPLVFLWQQNSLTSLTGDDYELYDLKWKWKLINCRIWLFW